MRLRDVQEMAEILGRAKFRNSCLLASCSSTKPSLRDQKFARDLQALVHFTDFLPSLPPSTALPISYLPPPPCFLAHVCMLSQIFSFLELLVYSSQETVNEFFFASKLST